METLNSIMFEKFMDDEISFESYFKVSEILAKEAVDMDKATDTFSESWKELSILSKAVKKEIRANKFEDAAKHLEDMEKILDKAVDTLKKIDREAMGHPIVKMIVNAIRRSALNCALTIYTAIKGWKLSALIAGGLTFISTLDSIIQDMGEMKSNNDITDSRIKDLTRNLLQFKAVIRKLSSSLASKKLKEALKNSDETTTESTVDDDTDVITNLYIEGTIDDETYIDLMTESDDEDDATECYDKAIEILTKLKEKPGDKKLTEKLKDVLDDCCECDEKDDKKKDDTAEEKKDDDDEAEEAEAPAEEEEVAEESTIVIESEDPVVAEIMESVEAMVADLDYASAIMESDLMMTESTDVLKSVMTDVKARLAGVGNMLKELKAKVVDVSDNGARAKIAKILNDLAKRFTALVGTAKDKIAGLANASKKTPDAPNA